MPRRQMNEEISRQIFDELDKQLDAQMMAELEKCQDEQSRQMDKELDRQARIDHFDPSISQVQVAFSPSFGVDLLVRNRRLHSIPHVNFAFGVLNNCQDVTVWTNDT